MRTAELLRCLEDNATIRPATATSLTASIVTSRGPVRNATLPTACLATTIARSIDFWRTL